MKELFCFILVFLGGFLFGQEKPKINGDNDSQNKPIILVGDSQHTNWVEFWREKNKGIQKIIFDKIADEDPLCILHLGDMVFRGASKKQWQDFDRDAVNVVSGKIPIYPVMGNHEYYGNNKTAFSYLVKRFPQFKNGTWYSENIGNIGVIFLNSNFGKLSTKERAAQQIWYEEELESFQENHDIDFIVVICHHPPFTNSTINKDNKKVQECFVAPFNNFPKAKLFFSGHTHSYEHFEKDGKHFIVSGGGGGPRHKLKPRKRKETIEDVYQGGKLRDFNFCKISFSGEALNFEMIKLDKETKEFSLGESFVIPK